MQDLFEKKLLRKICFLIVIKLYFDLLFRYYRIKFIRYKLHKGIYMNTQELEKYHFNEFILHYEIPNGKIIYHDKPDIIIESESRIGIEITNYYIKSGNDKNSEQRQKDIRNDILELAQQKYYQKSEGHNIHLSVTFNDKIKAKAKQEIAKNIVEMALQLTALPEGEICQSVFEHIDEIQYVYYRTTRNKELKWNTVQSYDVTPISINELIRIIDEKNNKIKDYEDCNSFWLLITMDYFDPAQYQELSILDDYVFEKSKFSKIIVFLSKFGHFKELKQGK